MLKAHWKALRERVAEQKEIHRRTRDLMPDYTGIVAVLLVAVLALGMILYLGMVSATAEGRTMWVCTDVDPLNVRDGPSLHAPWVYRLDRGEAVTVHDTKDGWAYVERCGDYGWCWAAYLAERPPVDKLPEGWLAVEED